QKPSINFELSRMAEIAPYTVRGCSWYQGESNAWGFDIAQRYREELQMLVDDWRSHWKDDSLPFLIVQLPHYPAEERPEKPGEITPWDIVMEAQWNIQKDRPAVHTVVTADLGTPGDIHPKRKAPIGERLSLLVRERILDEDVAGSNPAMTTMTIKDETVEIEFKHAYKGLEMREVKHTPVSKDKLEGFLIAESDRYFVRADARITGKNTVVCRNADIANPAAVRYAMHADTLFNLYNSAGLPATPFRTDDWEVDTPQRKQRTVRATKINSSPEIDGKMRKSEQWEAADPIEGLEVFHTYRPADPQTRANFTWNEHGLHVALECPQPMDQLRAEAKKRDDESIWTDDNVQLLLDANHDKRNYIRIVINPAGTVADGKGFNDWQAEGRLLHQGLLPYYRNFNLDADLDFKSAVSKSDAGWNVELTIPWSTLDIQFPPRDDQSMGVQITRTHAATDERSEWATTGRDYNTGAMMPRSWVKGQRLHHGVGRFGTLTLDQ
ncbi:MAG: sialate O-acetylesterase, partial [Verrucomicrobiota bacterium]